MIWKCGSYAFDSQMPIIMGILNVTPDSFSDGGLYASPEEACAAARKMVSDGALIIDVGGESTRPGADPVEVEEELARVLPVVRQLASEDICVSIDTRHARVAKACVEAGASIINDVSGFRDPKMVQVAADCQAGLVIVHMGGDDPKTMQDDPHYRDVVRDVSSFLALSAAQLELQGIERSRICLDPGPGFGKTADQTVQIMRNFHELNHLGYPTMVAVSRKSYIGKRYNIEELKDRDEASAKEALFALELGASVVRTHNVKLTAQTIEESLRPYALIGVGSNIALVGEAGEEQEGKVAQVNLAIGDMVMLPDTQVIDVSSYYESQPAYLKDQDTFINAVVLIRTGLPPQELLKYLQAIEDSLGRVRTIKNGPRTIDLDILDYQGYVSDLEVLKLPHPLLLERDFVVKPLLEILPHHILSNGIAVTDDQVKYGKATQLFLKNPFEWQGEHRFRVTSTNMLVKEAISRGREEGFYLRADEQEKGQGMLNHLWSSPKGGLYFSFILDPYSHHSSLLASTFVSSLSLVISLAVRSALVKVSGCDDIRIKWPNDVVYQPVESNAQDPFFKLCGISLELIDQKICIGVGINIERPEAPLVESHAESQAEANPYHQPGYLADIAAKDKEEDQENLLDRVFAEVLDQIQYYYVLWLQRGFGAFVGEYDRFLFNRGSLVAAQSADGAEIAKGEVLGVRFDGALMLKQTDGSLIPLFSGETHTIPLP